LLLKFKNFFLFFFIFFFPRQSTFYKEQKHKNYMAMISNPNNTTHTMHDASKNDAPATVETYAFQGESPDTTLVARRPLPLRGLSPVDAPATVEKTVVQNGAPPETLLPVDDAPATVEKTVVQGESPDTTLVARRPLPSRCKPIHSPPPSIKKFHGNIIRAPCTVEKTVVQNRKQQETNWEVEITDVSPGPPEFGNDLLEDPVFNQTPTFYQLAKQSGRNRIDHPLVVPIETLLRDDNYPKGYYQWHYPIVSVVKQGDQLGQDEWLERHKALLESIEEVCARAGLSKDAYESAHQEAYQRLVAPKNPLGGFSNSEARPTRTSLWRWVKTIHQRFTGFLGWLTAHAQRARVFLRENGVRPIKKGLEKSKFHLAHWGKRVRWFFHQNILPKLREIFHPSRYSRGFKSITDGWVFQKFHHWAEPPFPQEKASIETSRVWELAPTLRQLLYPDKSGFSHSLPTAFSEKKKAHAKAKWFSSWLKKSLPWLLVRSANFFLRFTGVIIPLVFFFLFFIYFFILFWVEKNRERIYEKHRVLSAFLTQNRHVEEMPTALAAVWNQGNRLAGFSFFCFFLGRFLFWSTLNIVLACGFNLAQALHDTLSFAGRWVRLVRQKMTETFQWLATTNWHRRWVVC
jgi:hypothetical protein